jgi:universal stress protein E
MKAIRRILFAVRNPEDARQPGIDKAIQVARSFGASLEVFHALSSPVFLTLQPMMEQTLEALRASAEKRARERLAKYAAKARRQGVALECQVAWDYPPHEAIVRRAAAARADLIIAECHKGPRSRAWLLHLTDWELLRLSPLPVLLLRNGRAFRRPLTLAAVDPAHAHAKPAELDSEILAAATLFSKALRGSLHLMHANHPATLPVAMAAGDPGIAASASAVTYAELLRQERAGFEAFTATTAVPRARTHLVDGHPAFAIPRLARKLHAGLVVMGAVSRSGVKRVFVGNTAERVLNALPCDVLVVKPAGFTSQVRQESRGMRIVAPPPLSPLMS